MDDLRIAVDLHLFDGHHSILPGQGRHHGEVAATPVSGRRLGPRIGRPPLRVLPLADPRSSSFDARSLRSSEHKEGDSLLELLFLIVRVADADCGRQRQPHGLRSASGERTRSPETRRRPVRAHRVQQSDRERTRDDHLRALFVYISFFQLFVNCRHNLPIFRPFGARLLFKCQQVPVFVLLPYFRPDAQTFLLASTFLSYGFNCNI